MKQRERAVMEKVYACINRMSGMAPTNPADMKMQVQANKLLVAASGKLVHALSSVNFGDLHLAHEHADDAKKTLGLT